MISTRTYLPAEIQRGLAVFLSPNQLIESMKQMAPATFYLPPTGLDKHYFLVLARDGETAAITPLTSHPNGVGWVPVSSTGKTGHEGWVKPSTFYHPSQVWPVPVMAVIAAARTGGDLTWRDTRNRVLGKEIEVIEAAFKRERSDAELVRDVSGCDRMPWRLYWARYRSGEIWAELRLSSVVFKAGRIRFSTGRL